MDYVIKVGKNYIGLDGVGRFTEVSSINKAVKAPLHKVNNILNNCVAPTLRSKCKVVDASSIAVSAPKVIKEASTNTVTENTSLFDEVVTKLQEINGSGFSEKHSTLSQKLSLIDQEISDIQHYIEFNKLNAAEGYKAFKMLQDKLLQRRVIKNDMVKFQVLSSAKISDIFDGTLDKNLKEVTNKTYRPRVLPELFM